MKMQIGRSFIGGIIVLCIIGLMSTSVVHAQSDNGKMNVGLAISGVKMIGDEKDHSMISPWLNLSLGVALNDKIGLGLDGGFGWDRPFDKDEDSPIKYFKRKKGLKVRTLLYPIMMNLKYLLKSENKLSPYVVAGVGVLFWDLIDVTGEDQFFTGLRFGESVHGLKLNALANIGVGLQWFAWEYWSFDFSLRYQQLFDRDIDMTGFDDINTGNIESCLGLAYHFGGTRDSDNDGIPNKLDYCPKEAEDFDGFEDMDGCPDLDNDGDGITDLNDRAPNDAEDMDGFEDEDGIPDLDNDGDGINDSDDQDPNAAEDMDGFEDEDGIPDPDNDGDQILDVDDQCPNEAETMNDYEDEDGCPDKKQEMIIPEETSMVMEGVNFASGSVVLVDIAKEILDKLYRTLQANPKMKIEIHGYTDSIGSYENNLKLSRKRANVVKDYLANRGISSTRLIAKGFGEANPIASNKTKAGQAMNRRIEVIRSD